MLSYFVFVINIILREVLFVKSLKNKKSHKIQKTFFFCNIFILTDIGIFKLKDNKCCF